MTSPNEPPRPPSAPTPPAASGNRFDFAKPFTFFFEDPSWVPKILIGGLFQLLGIFIVGSIFLGGYYARLVRNVIAGVERPLPEWDDLGDYFVEGLKLFAVTLCFVVPMALLFLFVALFGAAIDQATGQEWISGLMGCFALLILVPLTFAVIIVLPAALLRVITEERFSAAFELKEVFSLIRASGFNYLLAIVVHLVAHFASQFGILLCVIGVFVTGFWALAATSHAFAQAYRLART